jgi:hypothetical protein
LGVFTLELELLCSPVLVGIEGDFFTAGVVLAAGFVFVAGVALGLDVGLVELVFGGVALVVVDFFTVLAALAAGLVFDAAGFVAAVVFGEKAGFTEADLLAIDLVFVPVVVVPDTVALGVALTAGPADAFEAVLVLVAGAVSTGGATFAFTVLAFGAAFAADFVLVTGGVSGAGFGVVFADFAGAAVVVFVTALAFVVGAFGVVAALVAAFVCDAGAVFVTGVAFAAERALISGAVLAAVVAVLTAVVTFSPPPRRAGGVAFAAAGLSPAMVRRVIRSPGLSSRMAWPRAARV